MKKYEYINLAFAFQKPRWMELGDKKLKYRRDAKKTNACQEL